MTTRGQLRHAFPAFRVFIFGVDVTEDVLEVSVDWNKGRAPNRCSIVLANVDDKFVYTTVNLTTIFDEVTQLAFQQKISELVNAGQEADEIGEIELDEQDINEAILTNVRAISPEIKRTIISRKITVRNSNAVAPEVDGSATTLNPLRGDAFRYPFQAEDPIFHPNDPIRIFFRDPFNANRWYHMFAGFASDFDDNVDENNQKILTIGGEGPSKALRYARITFNPGIIDVNVLAQQKVDVAIRTFWQSGLANLTLPELLFFIVFGNDPENDDKFSLRRDSPVGQSITQATIGGVGNFNFKRSAVLEFGPSSSGGVEDALQGLNILPVENLSTWQSLIDHEVKITDLEEMAVEEFDGKSFFSNVIRFGDGTPDPTSIITILGENPQLFPVDGGRLLLLIPASFHPSVNREVLLRDIIKNPAMQTEFSSRLRVIYDTIERIEFIFYESPKGDLICEFPLYDFDPDDWNLKEKIPHISVENQKIFTSVNESRGPFGGRFVIDKKNTYNFSKQINDEKVRTQVIGHFKLFQGYDVEGSSRDIQAGAVITLEHLIPLYGLRLEQIDPKGFISTKEAAYAYSHLILNQMNADARNIGINAVPNFGLWLNRPILFVERNCIGTTTSVGHSIKWGMGGSVDTRVNINFIRGWDGLLDENGNPVYATIGGLPSRPLNYKVLFKLTNPTTGVNTETPQT